MIKEVLTGILLISLAPSIYAVTFNDNITAIFGGGNPDTGWTSASGSEITLALRGKNRDTGATPQPNTPGVYEFATGFSLTTVTPNTRGLWNWEFSIDTGGAALNAFDFFVSVDTDPSQGISYTTVNALTFFGFSDNSYGTSSTLNGQGLETGLAAALGAGNTVAQQSQNLVFAGGNPLLDATYNYQLFAVAAGAGENGARLADVGIMVVAGAGGAPVPDAGGTLAMLGLGVAGLMGFSFRKRALVA